MKNLFTKMMLVAVAAMTFIGCSQEPTEINATVKKTTIDLLVNIDDVTRSSFGDKAGDGSYPSVWNSYDSVQVYAVDANDNIIAKGYGNVEIPEGGDGSTAAVRATFDGVETFADLGVTKLYAYVGGWDFYASETALPVLSIKAKQTPASASVESGVHTLKAETEWDGSTGQVNLTFSHAAAYGRMVLPQFEGTAVKSVEITLNGTTTTLDTRNLDTNVYWFATEAIDEVTTFSVTAVSGLFTYSKEIDMTGKTLKFITGQVSEFSVKDLVKEELTADAEVTFTDMAYDSENDLWKFTNADGDYAYIPFVTETKGELVSGTYTAASDMNTVGTYNANNTVVKYGTKPETYPGFNYGDITVTVDGINVNVDILFEIYDETDTTDYKSLFHGVYSIVAPTGEFATELATVKSMYYSPETSRSLWITTETTPAGVFSIFLTLSVGEDGEAFAVIPEGTYTFGADSGFAITTDSHANIETAEQYVNISEGTLTVSHVGEEYKLVLDITNAEDAHITATWQGVITGQWTWANDIPHPGYVIVTKLATPEVTATAEGNTITVSWDAVENAYEYIVSCKETGEVMTVNASAELEAAFTELEYETTYNFTVVANPESDSTSYEASEPAEISKTTEADPNAVIPEPDEVTPVSAYVTDNTRGQSHLRDLYVVMSDETKFRFEITCDGVALGLGEYQTQSSNLENYIDYSYKILADGTEQQIVVYELSVSYDVATQNYTIAFGSGYNWATYQPEVGFTYTGAVTGLTGVPDTTPSMELSTKSLEFNPETASKTVDVILKYTNEAITATSDNAQFTASVNGTTVTVTASENTSSDEITGTITINCGTLSDTVSVRQLPAGTAAADGKTVETAYTFSSYSIGDDGGWPVLIFGAAEDGCRFEIESNDKGSFPTGLQTLNSGAWYTTWLNYFDANGNKIELNLKQSYSWLETSGSGYSVEYFMLVTSAGDKIFYKYDGIIYR